MQRTLPLYKYVPVFKYDDFVGAVKRGRKLISWIGPMDSQDLSVALQQVRPCKLRGFSVRGIMLDRECLELILKESREHWDLEELRLSAASIDNICLEAIALSIKQDTSLLTLNLFENLFTNISSLAESLKTNMTLQYLDIGRARFTDPAKAIIDVARALKVNRSLKGLWIEWSHVEDSGAIALASALEVNNHLVLLSLRQNNIESQGAHALAQCLNTNTTLRNLDLDYNQLSSDVVAAFAIALGEGGNRTLRNLGLRSNLFYECIRMESVLKVNNVIEELRLDPSHVVQATTRRDPSRERIYAELKRRNRKLRTARLKAITKAQDGNSTTPWLRSKLMVVGRGAAGKTNTVRSLLGLNFNPEWDSTVGIDLTEVATAFGSMWKRTENKDFASAFVHRLAVEALDTSKVLEKKDTPQTETTGVVKTQVAHAASKTSTTTNAPVVQEQESPSKRERKEPTVEYQRELFMAQEDSKDSIRMSIWDYGGQTVFYTLHHLFLTQYGVYLIVFNMAKLLDNQEKTCEYLSFWLNSIKLHAPNAPVLLVGTFLDAIITDTTSLEEKQHLNSQMLSAVERCCSGFDQVRRFDKFAFCPISNKDKSGIQRLRDAIEHETKVAEFVQTPVSLKWMRALDILAQSSDRPWMEVAELKVEVNRVGIEREQEMENMLRLFHELGVVLYFSSSVRLKEVVIWKPEWLLEKLSVVIRDKDVHGFDKAKLKEIKLSQLSQDLKCFLQDGIISRDLLDFLWEKSQVDYLIELMRHLLLLSNWKFSKEEQYLIPSMPSSAEKPSQITGAQFYLEFNFLPPGVFERLCCLCVGYSSSLQKTSPPQLYRSNCIVDLGVKGFMQAVVERNNKITVTVSQITDASMVLNFFLSMMLTIQHDFMHGGLQWQVFVGDHGKFVKHSDAEARKLEPWVRKKETPDSVAIEKLLDF